METKFTPGPWRISSDPWHYDTLSVVTAGGERKGHPNRQMIIQVGGFAGPQEQEANARLAAAAPELLEACRGMLVTLEVLAELDGKQCDYVEPRHDSLLKVADVLDSARAAISKAIGA